MKVAAAWTSGVTVLHRDLQSWARFGGDLLGPYVSKKIFESGTDFHNEFDRWTFGAALKISKNV